MTKHSVPRRTVIGGGLGLGAGLATGVVQAQLPAEAPQSQTRPQAAAAAPTIGVLTSTVFSEFQYSFDQGFGSTPNYVLKEAKGEYDAQGSRHHRKMYTDMADLNRNAAVTLIIVAGGLAAAHAAVQKSEKPFLVLIGRIPESSDFVLTDNDQYFGGVNLNTVQANKKRGEALNLPFNQICLLYNPNSRMSISEANEWSSLGGKVLAALTGDNDESTALVQFDNAFAHLPQGTKGVVISGDPFFTNQRSKVVSAAGQAFSTNQIKTCYPFPIYQTANPTPAGSYAIVGPNLTTPQGTTTSSAYKTLGAKALAISNALSSGNPVTFQGLDDLAI
jgi:hypothetical protein